MTGIEALVTAGTAAVAAGDYETAERAFATAVAEGATGAELLEGLGKVAYLKLDFDGAIDHYERAYAAYREAGNGIGAVRMARNLSFLHSGIRGDGAVGGGWLARAQTLVDEAGETAERGWVALSRGMFEPERDKKEAHFRIAIDAGRTFGDTDLYFSGLAYLGGSQVHSERVEEGMVLLDEALAAVAGGDVKEFFAIEEIFCQLFSACEYTFDVTRADQWIRIGSEISSRRNLPAVSAFCRTHYGGLLTAAGRWSEADAELSEAARIWEGGYTSLRWTALVRLADLRVRQGRLEEAAELLEGLDLYTEAARPLAAIQFARGDVAIAVDTLERALAQMETDATRSATLLGLLVEVELSRDGIEAATAAVERLERLASSGRGEYVCATAALARGALCLATGVGDPRTCLREALSGFSKAQMPMELARARLELARALTEERPEVAVAEARASLEAFERLQAARDADAAAALLRRLGAQSRTGPKGEGGLTKREAEVLELLGHGLSNPEIADRLYISRKTVEHHVGSVLSKLQLKSRAQAAAYAARSGQRSAQR